MSQSYTITEARQGRTYDSKYGEMVVWLVKLENATAETASGAFELHKKPGNTPQAGDTIEVERFSQGEFDGSAFIRIYLAKPQNTSSTSSSGGGHRQSDGPGLRWRSAPFERGAEHPRNEARQIHTSCLSAAPAYYELFRTEGVIDKAEDKPSMLNTLAGIVAWLESGYGPVLDAVAAPASGVGQNGAERPSPQPEIPADTTGFQPAVDVAPDSDPLPF